MLWLQTSGLGDVLTGGAFVFSGATAAMMIRASFRVGQTYQRLATVERSVEKVEKGLEHTQRDMGTLAKRLEHPERLCRFGSGGCVEPEAE